MPSRQVFLGLGSNVGERQANLEAALAALEREHIRRIKQSSVYETEPQDVKEQPWFLNLVVRCETECFPVQLLSILQRIEREMGRVRGANTIRRGPRVIDIDILLFGSVVMNTRQLTIPHPRMLERRFVLEPLMEIAPGLRYPGSGELLEMYLRRVTGQRVQKR